MAERVSAIEADVVWRSNTGQVEADLQRLRREHNQATSGMSDEALRLSVAQDRLDKAIARHGPTSTQARNAQLSLRREMAASEQQARRYDVQVDRNTRSLERFGRGALAGSGALRSLRGALVFASSAFLGGAGLIYAIRSTVDASLAFESAFAGIRKTVEATEPEFAGISREIRALSREIPIAVTDLARIGELGGQLGIGKQSLVSFTRTIADLGQTTDLSVEQAATSLAQLAAITRLPQREISRLGSTTVALGNNFATTESKGLELVAGGARVVADMLGGAENAARLFFLMFTVRKLTALVGGVRGLQIALGLLGPTTVTSAATSTIALNTIRTTAVVNAARVGTLRAALLALGGSSVLAALAAAAAGVAAIGAVAAVAGGAVIKGLSEADEGLGLSKAPTAKRIADAMERQNVEARRRMWGNLSPSMRKAVGDELRARGRFDILIDVGAADTGTGSIPDEGDRHNQTGAALVPKEPASTGGGGGSGADKPKRTELDVLLDLDRAGRTRTRSDDLRLLRELGGIYERQIRALERRKSLSDEQKQRLRELYSAAAQNQAQIDAIVAEGERKIAEERDKAATARKEAQSRALERVSRREQILLERRATAEATDELADDRRALARLREFYLEQARNDEISLEARRDFLRKRQAVQRELGALPGKVLRRRLDLREQALENKLLRAQLTETLADDRRTLEQLVQLYRRASQNLDLVAKERQAYGRKRLETLKKLQDLREQERSQAASSGGASSLELINEFLRIQAEFGPNFFPDGSFRFPTGGGGRATAGAGATAGRDLSGAEGFGGAQAKVQIVQNFPNAPTDYHREARYAQVAATAVFDG